jgi:hypothetical protein
VIIARPFVAGNAIASARVTGDAVGVYYTHELALVSHPCRHGGSVRGVLERFITAGPHDTAGANDTERSGNDTERSGNDTAGAN